MVSGDEDIHGTREGLEKIFLADLKLQQETVDLVNDDDGLDTISQCLEKDSLHMVEGLVSAVAGAKMFNNGDHDGRFETILNVVLDFVLESPKRRNDNFASTTRSLARKVFNLIRKGSTAFRAGTKASWGCHDKRVFRPC